MIQLKKKIEVIEKRCLKDQAEQGLMQKNK